MAANGKVLAKAGIVEINNWIEVKYCIQHKYAQRYELHWWC